MLRILMTAAIATSATYVHAGELMHVSPDQVGPDSIVYWQGEYVGAIEVEGGEEMLAAQVVARRNDHYELVLYRGGLPGHGWEPDRGKERVTATLRETELAFENDEGYTYKVDNGTIIVSHDERGRLGVLERTFRTSPTLGLDPPEEATVLFDGSNVDQWRQGATITDDGLLEQGARSANKYGDIFVHVEYMLPFWDNSGRSNSGIYIQDRYEVQIFDSFGYARGNHEDGSLYGVRAPKVNVTLPPYHWQTFDLLFRAPRFNPDGEKIENARVSVIHNGILVQDDVELRRGTGRGGTRDEVPREHLYLQQHRGPCFFRNVWLIEDPDGWPDAVKESTPVTVQ